jgi:hypothetical protein
MVPGGGGEHARWWPPGRIAEKSPGTPYFLHTASMDSWVRKEDAKRSATDLESTPPLAPSSVSPPSGARARMGSTRRGGDAPMM